MCRELRPRHRYGLCHFLEHVHAPSTRLEQGLAHYLLRQGADLVVHLHGRDALAGACHLEIHVAQVVFVTKNVGKDAHLASLLDEAHCDTGDRCLHGTPASISESEPPHTVAIDDDPFDSRISATIRTV